jgi:hypothetical protein
MRSFPLSLVALALFLASFAFSAQHASAATDDQNLTGLIYLSDGTPLSATTWANNTSFAVWVNHGADWASAWRYPAAPTWYLTSGGAYSVVLPAAQKDVAWSNADPYRVEFDVSAITSNPGETDNATSHGTGDPGEFSIVGATDNAIVWNAADNWQRWDVVLLALPDLAVNASETLVSPAPPISVGTAVTFDATLRNLGAVDAADAVVRFTDGVPPGIPIGTDITVSSLPAGGSVPVQRTWNAGPAGLHQLCVATDPDRAIIEANETNNVACVDVLVTASPQTRPDYVPDAPQPTPPLRTGLSQPVSLSIQVLNQGNASGNATATIAFYNASTPGNPFATALVPQLLPSEVSVRFAATWISPATPGAHDVSANVDYGNSLSEWDEANNVFTWQVDVVTGPVTSLVLGAPNVTAARTYVTSSTDLSFSVLDQGGSGIRSTWHRLDNGTWTNYSAAGPFQIAGEGPHFLEWYSEDFAGNAEAIQNAMVVVDDTPPITTPSVGDPKYVAGGTFVTSGTPFSLAAVDGGLDPVGLASTEYRIDTGSWTPYAAPFTVSGEGAHGVALRSFDRLGNAEVVGILPITIDDSPPRVLLSVGVPQYVGTSLYVNSSTPLTITASDGGVVPVGLASVDYRIGLAPWTPFANPFNLSPPDGTWHVEYAATDHLGHRASDATDLVLDDTSPETTITPSTGPYTEDTILTLAALDAGSGVARTEVRIDGDAWTPYTGGFTLSAGDHLIRYRSADRLNNTEVERTLFVNVEGAPPPPVPNWKPVLAAAFATVLAVAGWWASSRTGGGSRNRNLRRFAGMFLPFVVAEAATGVVSTFTGFLSIPPALGLGTVVDGSILIAGLGVAVYLMRRKTTTAPST